MHEGLSSWTSTHIDFSTEQINYSFYQMTELDLRISEGAVNFRKSGLETECKD